MAADHWTTDVPEKTEHSKLWIATRWLWLIWRVVEFHFVTLERSPLTQLVSVRIGYRYGLGNPIKDS